MSFQDVLSKARSAAEAAFVDAKPVPMAVQSSGLNEGFDWNKPYEVVSEGVCGFAWVNFAVDGRSKAAKELKAAGAYKDYYGGYSLWASDVAPSSRASQSYERKMAACRAAAKVFNEAGYVCYASGRLD